MHRVFCFFFSVVHYKVMIPSALNTELNKINSTSIGATYLINTIYSFLLLNFCLLLKSSIFLCKKKFGYKELST